MVLKSIIFVVWFFLPAGLANMVPVFAARMPLLSRWDYPIDGYVSVRGKRLFGTNKTVRGFVVGVIVAIATVMIQKELFEHWEFMRSIAPINYAHINPLLLGFLFGFGALAGDAVESFFKRQLNIPAGSSWMIFDQIDYIIGGIVLTVWYVPLSVEYYAYLLVAYFILHLITTTVGYFLGLKESPL